MRQVSFRTIAFLATTLIILLLAVQFGFHQQLAVSTGVNAHHAWLALNILAWIAGAVLAARLVQALGWNQIGRKTGRYAPYLLVQITNVLIYVSAAMGMAGVLFEIPLDTVVGGSFYWQPQDDRYSQEINSNFETMTLQITDKFGRVVPFNNNAELNYQFVIEREIIVPSNEERIKAMSEYNRFKSF